MTTQETTQDSGTVIELRGAWRGGVQDPQRSFVGVVTASQVPDLPAGQRVTVAYQVAAGRTPNAGEHGGYHLTGADGRRWPLMRFTCHDTGMTGHEGNDDTAEATWQAVTLPG
jgi:hypothetical protein